MNKRKIILLVFGILLLAGGIGGILLHSRWDKPLGPSLDLPTYTPTPPIPPLSTQSIEAGMISVPAVTSTQIAASMDIITPEAFPTPTNQPVCNGPTEMTILAIGSDQRSNSYLYGLADSIHIVHIDFTTSKIMVIDFPRDLWVEIPEISDHYGITHGKLNQAYLYGNPGMGYYDGPGEGPGLLARTLDLNFGLRVDHYVAIGTQTFVKVIDAVGGVDITVEEPIDMSYGYRNPGPDLFLSPGIRHLDGKHALILATNRIPSTFQRMKYQKIILTALRGKLLSAEMLPKIPGLVAKFLTSVQTDFSLSEIDSLICIAQATTMNDIRMDSFPQEMFTTNATYDEYRRLTTFTYSADFNLIRSMMVDFTNGIWPFP